MKALDAAVAWFRLVLFATLTAAFQYLKDFLGHQLSAGTATIVAVVTLIFLFKLTSSLADLAVGRSRFIRRMLLGRSFIEGLWIHRVRDADGRPISIGLIRIDYVNGQLLVSGEAWDAARCITNFTSETSFYDGYMLTFTYGQFGTMDDAKGHESGLIGIGKYRFTPRGDGPPEFCTGFFFDGAVRRFYRLVGERLAKGKDIPHDITGKLALVREALRD